MRVLILYATIEGQTGKVAAFLGDQATAAGHEPELVDVGNKMAIVDFDGFEKIVLAAPVHERRHPEPFEVFLTGHRDILGDRQTLLLSISLSAAFADGLEEARDYLTEMEMRTGFTPTGDALVAGAVKTGSYDYFASQVVRHVVLGDRDYDPTKGDHEFTDWDALAITLTDFLTAPTD